MKHENDSLQPYLEFILVFRKTNKDPNKGMVPFVQKAVCSFKVTFEAQMYQIPPDADHPHIDCYHHMLVWLGHLQGLLQRSLDANDYIFPALASTGFLKFGEPISRSGFEALLEKVVEGSGVMAGRAGKFTTHCFRRGGAQYRFMFADHKWSLKAVKWWGGWSSSENVCNVFQLRCHTCTDNHARLAQSCVTYWMS